MSTGTAAAGAFAFCAERLFAGPGEVRAICRALDWSVTALGPVEHWPQSLRTAVELCLAFPEPASVFWGPHRGQLYNDAFLSIAADRHPAILGRAAAENWSEVWPIIGPLLDTVLTQGTSRSAEHLPLKLRRGDVLEERLFSFSLTPLRDESGQLAGAFLRISDTTAQAHPSQASAPEHHAQRDDALAERDSFRIALSDALRPLVDPARIQAEAARVLGRHLRANRVHYAEVDGDDAQIRADYCDGVSSVVGWHRLSSYAQFARELLLAGHNLVVPDVRSDARFSLQERALLTSIDIAAMMAVPLVKGGHLTGILVVHQIEPRAWTADEVLLLEKTAERTWAAVERARAESALRESEARYRSLFTAMDEGFLLAELVRDDAGHPVDFRLLELNPAFEKLTGLTLPSMTGRTARELVPKLDPWWIETYARLVETGEPIRFERYTPSLDRWYAVVAFARGGDQFAALYDDITSRKKAEQALRATESRFRTLVQNVRDYAIFIVDPSGIITEWTEGAERVMGYRAQEAIGQHVSLLYSKEDVANGEAWRELAEASRRGRAEREVWRMRRGGGRFWANEITTAIHDPSGTPVGFTKVSRDLSERKHMQDALRDVEQRHRLIVESARDFAIFMTDPEGRITTWNPGAEHIFGYSAFDIIGRPASVLFTPEAAALGAFERELGTAASEGRASDDGWQLRKDGTRFWASGVMASMRDEAGRLRGFVKVLRDRTDARRVEEERERVLQREKAARRDAEAAMRMRDEFVAVVSHELRTPLSAILLWARMLRAGAIKPQDQARALVTIEQSATAQRKLIDDLLDASRMLSGKVQLSVREVELAPLIHSAIEVVRPMSEAKGVLVTAELADTAAQARVDPDRLQQVLWNLLHNALKFTPAGGRVCVRLSRLQRAVRLEVEDTGRGISPAFLPHVFERFRQADTSTTREHGGLGLGLSITHQLVELHGGTIRASSAGEGRGATFTIELPLVEVGVPPAGEAPSAQGAEAKAPLFVPSALLTGVRVLIVEDETHTRTVLQWLLEQCGAEVTATGSAEEGLAALESGARFDVLVSDVALPGRDGYSLLRQLRKSPAGRQLPALALTAYTREEDRSRAREAGFEEYMAKPVEPQALVQAIAGLARLNARADHPRHGG